MSSSDREGRQRKEKKKRDVPRMVLIEVGPVVVLSSSQSSSSRMLSVLTHTTVTAVGLEEKEASISRWR